MGSCLANRQMEENTINLFIYLFIKPVTLKTLYPIYIYIYIYIYRTKNLKIFSIKHSFV